MKLGKTGHAVLYCGLTYDGVGKGARALRHDPLYGDVCDVSPMLVGHISQNMDQPPPQRFAAKSLHRIPVQLETGGVQIQQLVFVRPWKAS